MNYGKEVGLLLSSHRRVIVMEYLASGKPSTPTIISKRTDIIPNHMSNILKDLKNNQLIVCLNDEARKGRLYTITERGRKVLKELEDVNYGE